MNYSLKDIRMNILNLKDGSQEGFFIEIPGRGEIVFHRNGNKIIIRNKNLNGNSLEIDRDNLNRGKTEKDKDTLFGVFLENLKGSALSRLGL